MTKDRLEDLFFSKTHAIKDFEGNLTTGLVYSDIDHLINQIWKEIQEDYGEKFKGESVRCDLCCYVWVAVFPSTVQQLECPNCHNMTNIELYNPAND